MVKRMFTRRVVALVLAGLFGTLAGRATMEGTGADRGQGAEAVKKESRDFPSTY